MSSDKKARPDTTETPCGQAAPKRTLKEENQDKYLKFRHSGEISKEFGRQIARGEDPRCTYPWNRLDIVLRDNRTKVCSDFPIRLPRFDWPTTEEFHNEDQMWNHPFMQRMRGGMGTEHAVPFCDICVRTNKRSAKNHAWRVQAQQQTRQLYHEIDQTLREDHYRGTLTATGEALKTMRFARADGKAVQMFTQPLDFYRRRVKKFRFFQVGRVLQIGLDTVLVSPFLAEANPQYAAADFSHTQGDFMSSVVSEFGLEAEVSTLDPSAGLPYADNSFDAVWLEGPILFRMDRDLLFAELKRILGADGVLHLHEAYGPGRLLQLVLDDPYGNNGRCEPEEVLERAGFGPSGPLVRSDTALGPSYLSLFAGDMEDRLTVLRRALDASVARSVLLGGLRHQGIGSLVTETALRRVLRKYDLTLDTVMAPRVKMLKPETHGETRGELGQAALASDNALMDALGGLALDPQKPLTDVSNYDGTLIFNAFANVTNRKGTAT